MANQNPLTPVSVGSLVKKILAIAPGSQVQEIVLAIRQATRVQESINDGFGAREITDEALALKIARDIQTSRAKAN